MEEKTSVEVERTEQGQNPEGPNPEGQRPEGPNPEGAPQPGKPAGGFRAVAAKLFGGVAFKIVVVALLGGIVGLLLVERFAPRDNAASLLEASVKAKLGQLENKTEEEIQAELDRIIEEGMFHVAINARPIFEDGRAEGNLEIENVPNNLYAMRVEITLDDTGEVVYNSGLIDPNYHIQSDVLSVDLDEGRYPATATFYAYDMDTLEEMGTVSARLTIYIKN